MQCCWCNKQIYWSVPGAGFGENGAIYWEYMDAAAPAGNDLTAAIGQVANYLRV